MISPIETTDAPEPAPERWSRWQRRGAALLPVVIAGLIGMKVFDQAGAVALHDRRTAVRRRAGNALDPIYFTFDGSEALFLETQRARQPGAAPAAVEIPLQDETTRLRR